MNRELNLICFDIKMQIWDKTQLLVILIRSEFDGEFGGEDHVADPEGWGGIPTCPDLNAPPLV